MTDYERPTVVYKKSHICGLPEVGIAWRESARYLVLPEKYRKLKAGDVIKTDEYLRMTVVSVSYMFKADQCSCCEKEPSVIDRGVPLCDDHEQEQDRLWEKRPNLFVPEMQDIDSDDPMSILF